LNRFAQNDPGATQVMTDATPGEDPFAWLRTGYRRAGETSLWGRALGVSGETDGEAARGVFGTEFTVVGAIVGVDHVVSQKLLLGLAAQWTTTDIDFPGQPNKARVESIETGAYASFGDARLYLNANTSVIWHAIDVRRVTASGRAAADYNGTTVSAFAEAGKIFETEEGLRIQPFVALSYSHLDTDGYGETGTGTLLDVSGATVDSLKSMLGLRVGYPIELGYGRRMVPELRVAWQHEFLDDQASFLARIRGGAQPASLILGERFSRDTVIAGAGVTVPIAAQSTIFLDYDANLNPDLVTHTASAGVRVIW
jgi:outer membrane autotransporter protein